MKKLIFMVTVFPAIAFAQQSVLFTKQENDSLAHRNVNSVLHHAKKSFSQNSFSGLYLSEIQANVSELVRNTHTFNTGIRGYFEPEYNSVFVQPYPGRIPETNPAAVRSVMKVNFLDKK